MSNTNRAKAAQLGMPFGTATSRLRKQLLFKYVRLAGDDICHVCGEYIESIEEFTIEHKQPWFNRASGEELFWDLDNIAFSHANCNRPHIKGANRKQGPEGTSWCSGCNDFRPVEEFHKDSERFDGYHARCKVHRQR